MAITLYTGVPGSGKSHELVSEIIVPAVAAGRRVVTNVDGIMPEKVRHYCAIKFDKPLGELGEVVTFEDKQALAPGFFPTRDIPDSVTFLKGGDVFVFDEFKNTFPPRQKIRNPDLDPFLMWHRHLTDDQGRSCDVALGCQYAAQVHQDLRPLIERNFKLQKMKAIGRPTNYGWATWTGHLQSGDPDNKGVRSYNPEIFPLYKSYNGGDGVELQGDKRENALTGFKAKATMWSFPILFVGGFGGLWWAWSNASGGEAQAATSAAVQASPGQLAPTVAGAAPHQPDSPWRVMGHVDGDGGMRVIVSRGSEEIRTILPDTCRFDQGKPTSCEIDGRVAYASERLPSASGGMPSLLQGMQSRAN